MKFEVNSNNKEYKVKIICNSMVYNRKLEVDYLLSLYYLYSEKGISSTKTYGNFHQRYSKTRK